ncbi:M23 family peptidase, partial [Streptomyces sp. ST1020]
MAFTCATGRRRKATRMQRTTARAAGIAALTTSALAAGSPPEPTAANAMTLADDTVTMRLDVTEHVDDRAHAQEHAVQQAAVRARTEALRVQAAEEAKAARAAEARAAREAERARLNAFVAPITGSYVSTGYRSGGSLWSSGSH